MKSLASRERSVRAGDFFINLALVALGALLFSAAFPNLLVEKGLPLLAWIALVPVFALVRRTGLRASFFWGALYGYAAYSLFNYWLSVFHPMAGLIVNSVYLFYLGLLFPLLKIAELLFPRRFYLVQWVLWVSYEYLRTQGFLGYPYGIIGYSQWEVIPLIQIASLCGVWGVSALLVFPSAWLGAALQGNAGPNAAGPGLRGRPALAFRDIPGNIGAFFRRERVSALVWLICLCAALGYGFFSQVDYSGARRARIALIQHNTDPWRGDIKDYRHNYEVLKRLSDEALGATPKPDLVVWSETAFVPRIYWHSTYRGDRESWDLVKELLDYLAAQDVPFLIGNDDGRKDPVKNPNRDPLNPQEDYRIDYNAVMLYEKGNLTGLYRKLHLVPFTEHFPYEKQLPWMYKALKEADTHFWEKGEEATVFSTGGFKFSSPICFEDTFGYLSRDFVRNGAELIVNLSNDAWSASLPAQNQHLSMAVFRAVENRRSMVRSTASGQTCAVDPNGRLIALAPPFTESALTVEVPVITPDSLYTRFGDFLAFIFVGAAITLLIFGSLSYIIITVKKGRDS
ncbi:apolipoprotein N-acyltransferase 1 [Spirochaetia bacterium]|nr:apolipoprotein N-acyltransferase 1 [Spirochaetia bacterium]